MTYDLDQTGWKHPDRGKVHRATPGPFGDTVVCTGIAVATHAYGPVRVDTVDTKDLCRTCWPAARIATDSDIRFREFVYARIHDEEQLAVAAGHGHSSASRPFANRPNADWTEVEFPDNVRPSYDLRLIRVWSPDRIVEEFQIKRAVLDLHASRNGYCDTCGGMAPCRTVKLVAFPYRQHRDFLPEWLVTL